MNGRGVHRPEAQPAIKTAERQPGSRLHVGAILNRRMQTGGNQPNAFQARKCPRRDERNYWRRPRCNGSRHRGQSPRSGGRGLKSSAADQQRLRRERMRTDNALLQFLGFVQQNGIGRNFGPVPAVVGTHTSGKARDWSRLIPNTDSTRCFPSIRAATSFATSIALPPPMPSTPSIFSTRANCRAASNIAQSGSRSMGAAGTTSTPAVQRASRMGCSVPTPACSKPAGSASRRVAPDLRALGRAAVPNDNPRGLQERDNIHGRLRV